MTFTEALKISDKTMDKLVKQLKAMVDNYNTVSDVAIDIMNDISLSEEEKVFMYVNLGYIKAHMEE